MHWRLQIMNKAQFTALTKLHDDYEDRKLTISRAKIYKDMAAQGYAVAVETINAYQITNQGYIKFMEERTKREPSRCPNTIELEVLA